MSALPLTEAILLEILQSLGGTPYPTNKKNKFSTGQVSLDLHTAMCDEVISGIFNAFGMDEQAQSDAIYNLVEFINNYKSIELNVWTFAANSPQILWVLLGHLFIPGLARHVAFWHLEQPLDNGMAAGRFWYLPETRNADGKDRLYLPVAQVVDWLLDLLGVTVEQHANEYGKPNDNDLSHDDIRRSLYNWRNETPIRLDSIQKYFPDEAKLKFNGAFSLDITRGHAQQFSDALAFVKRKALTADKLRLEIAMTAPGRLEAILEGQANENEQAEFIKCLALRYAAPLMSTIRQRLRIARMVQDGYIRLLKHLCPNVDRSCTDPQQNKLLQICSLYKLVYNLTIDAWLNCCDQGESAENACFEEHLPKWGKNSLFLSILPSRRDSSNLELASFLTRIFFEMQADDELENLFGWDESSTLSIIQRNALRTETFVDERRSMLKLRERMRASSPWRTLQEEHRYWVVAQVAQFHTFGRETKLMAVQRLRELATSPAQTVQAILLELDVHLNGEYRNRPKDTRVKVEALIKEAEASDGYALWRAVILQYKAKHLLACNDFDSAEKLFRAALEASFESNFGTLRTWIAKDCLALAVANGKLIANNHEKYYREMLGGWMMKYQDVPPIEEVARSASEYFWSTLYRPYPDIPTEKRISSEMVKKIYQDLIPLLMSGNQDGLRHWIRTNQSLLKSPLPDVEGNSVLISLIKRHTQFMSKLPLMRKLLPDDLQDEQRKFEDMLVHWKKFLGLLAMESPRQLNMADLKGQTPLMLIAEAGDTALLKIMLGAGADPDMQDSQGMTALHAACKSLIDGCVDALLDHPCALDKLTKDGRSPLHTASWAGHIHAVKRLSLLAPKLVWHRDESNKTPLELAETLIEQPDELESLATLRAQDGKRCASKTELEQILQLLEQVPIPDLTSRESGRTH
ncbi:ankyrin repeat domain-containing protein [Leeia sp. TBRC 13508]|uniref:Ankyrin repeat domain-containing protein n=1 Tax=Leeia speluncae TaxID=2884804 RepID=A0ABS8DA91_9NEIS|nr:ankyrin repeat domain-containing protein [Leeia speluncae]MCB6185082.1 ankyrin repeat domain-containing protein [Leeia speluncae]